MKYCDIKTIVELAVRYVDKPAIYFKNNYESTSGDIESLEIIKLELSTMIDDNIIHELLLNDSGLLFFDNKDEIEKVMDFFCSDRVNSDKFLVYSMDEYGNILNTN